MPVSFSNSWPSSARPEAGSHWNHQTVIDFPAAGGVAAPAGAGAGASLLHPQRTRETRSADRLSFFMVRSIPCGVRGTHPCEQLVRASLGEGGVVDVQVELDERHAAVRLAQAGKQLRARFRVVEG